MMAAVAGCLPPARPGRPDRVAHAPTPDDPMVIWAARDSASVTWVAVRPALARRLLDVPRLQRTHRASAGRLVLRQLRPAPTDPPTGPWTKRPLHGPARRASPGDCNCPAGQPGQRGHRPGRRRPVRRPAPKTRYETWSQVTSVAGRYHRCPQWTADPACCSAKNPGRLAGGRSTWPTNLRRRCCPSTPATPTALDTSWLYDVDFSPLRGRRGPDHRRPGDGPRGPAPGQSRISFEHVTVVRPGAGAWCRPAGSRSSPTTPPSRTSERSWTVVN